jgi:predicted TIM-barrel fold metal-dependent hydrolase
MASPSDHVIVISTDGHCGAGVWDYKEYLEKKYHEEFDGWANTYHDAWSDLDAEFVTDIKVGAAAFDTPLNWDSSWRRTYNEAQGIVAEILFPNTAPPFSPSGVTTAPGPRDRREFELRFAGVRAHNRWLADLCNDIPGRRAGLAQVFLDDVDMAIDEVKRAHDLGLRGVALPADHLLKMMNLYYPKYDPLWAVCADLNMPIHRHTSFPTEDLAEGGPAAVWVGSIEVPFYAARAITHLICSGAFERFPGLKFVATELMDSAAIPLMLSKLDGMYLATLAGEMPGAMPIQEGVDCISRLPSSYYESNCFVAGPLDHRRAYEAGVKNLMFGADIPHAEGTAPFTKEALRIIFEDAPEEEIRTAAGLRAAHVYGFDIDFLQGLANQHGPTIEEITTPLRPGDPGRPDFPSDTRSRIFAAEGDPRIIGMTPSQMQQLR